MKFTISGGFVNTGLNFKGKVALWLLVTCFFASGLFVSTSGFDLPAAKARVPAQSTDISLVTVHALQDLRGINGEKGCDIWNPTSLGCQWAAVQFCSAHGFAGGAGPVEWSYSVAQIRCIPATSGAYREFAYHSGCSSQDPTSLACASASRRSCLQAGYQSSAGVVGSNDKTFATMCLTGSRIAGSVATTPAELATHDPACTKANFLKGRGCQRAVHLFCASRGYQTGFDVLEYDASRELAHVSCAFAEAVPSELTKSPIVDGYERPARPGTMLIGGPATAGDIIFADVIVNKTNAPLMIRKLVPFSTYTGASISRDMCFYVGRAQIYQFDDNDDGEVGCVYSEEAADPKIDFGPARGLLLKPGERFSFQGSPQWGAKGRGSRGEGLYAGALVTITPYTEGIRPLRRVRYPRWDSIYAVNGSYQPLTVPAGCQDASCGVKPQVVPPGKDLRNSNSWFVASKPTAIRGISFFLGSSLIPGTQKFKGCIRVVQQGGVNLITPVCFDFSSALYGPTAFNTILGPQQDGSSFVPLDIDIPAGALVGVDFTLSSEKSGSMDFASYLWFENP